jgi:PBP1b-binding outer membrane lipoprotein LpoB
MKKAFFLSAAFVIAISCGGGKQYRESLGDKEIKQTVNVMVSSLYSYLKKDWKNPALLEIQRIENHTSEQLNTRLLATEIVTNLVKKRIRFVDKSYTKEALLEIEKGMTGIVDPESAVPAGMLKSPNFFLYGTITQSDKNIVVTLSLKEIATGMVNWQDHKSFSRSAGSGNISF